jgi:hypothetical protein
MTFHFGAAIFDVPRSHLFRFSNNNTDYRPHHARMRKDKPQIYDYACHQGDAESRGYIMSSRAKCAAIQEAGHE